MRNYFYYADKILKLDKYVYNKNIYKVITTYRYKLK